MLGPPHSPQRGSERSKDWASCATGISSHMATAQPFPKWKGIKTIPTVPLHPPKAGTALLSRAHAHFAHHCQLFSHWLKMPPVHSFPPPFPLPHPLTNLSQRLPPLLPLPNPGSCYSSCLHCRSLLPLLPTPFPSKCPHIQTRKKITWKRL